MAGSVYARFAGELAELATLRSTLALVQAELQQRNTADVVAHLQAGHGSHGHRQGGLWTEHPANLGRRELAVIELGRAVMAADTAETIAARCQAAARRRAVGPVRRPSSSRSVVDRKECL